MTTPTVLTGSDAIFARGGRRVRGLAKDEPIDVTVMLRAPRLHGMRDDPRPPRGAHESAVLHGLGETDMAAVVAFAEKAKLTILRAEAAQRAVALRATAAAFSRIFSVRFGRYERAGENYRSYDQMIVLPAELARIIEAVVGFEDAQVMHTCFVRGKKTPPAAALRPAMLANAYAFPPDRTGKGQRIAVIGFADHLPRADLKAYAEALHGKAPHVREIRVCEPGREGERTANDREGLAAMLQLMVALAPDAHLSAYLTAASERGCIEGLLAAVYADKPPHIICLGWGAAEERLTGATVRAIDRILYDAAARDITVCAATGDSGSALEGGGDLASVQFPASSHCALACGGTALAAGRTGWAEEVWNEGQEGLAGGGGISMLAEVPPWQHASQLPLSVRTARRGRGVPDVAAHAARTPGVRSRIDKQWLACGGTALSTALWAALLARIGEALTDNGLEPLGHVAPTLYRLANPTLFNTRVIGGNETAGHVGGYFTRPGWDACSGLGTPNGTALLGAILRDADKGPGTTAKADVVMHWDLLPGVAHEVAEGRDGSIYALGMLETAAGRQLYRLTRFGWTAVPGAFGSALAVGLDGSPWLVNADGVIRCFHGTSWRVHPGCASSLALAADGVLWIVEHAGDRPEGAVQFWTGDKFEDGGMKAQRIKADAGGIVLALQADGVGHRLARGAWRRVARNVADLAYDATETLWAASRGGGRVWRLDASHGGWCCAQASVAVRLFGGKEGALIAVQENGTMFRADTNTIGVVGPA